MTLLPQPPECGECWVLRRGHHARPKCTGLLRAVLALGSPRLKRNHLWARAKGFSRTRCSMCRSCQPEEGADAQRSGHGHPGLRRGRACAEGTDLHGSEVDAGRKHAAPVQAPSTVTPGCRSPGRKLRTQSLVPKVTAAWKQRPSFHRGGSRGKVRGPERTRCARE